MLVKFFVLMQNTKPTCDQTLLLMSTKDHLNDSVIACCVSLFIRHITYFFLDRIVTGDEKWILYNNVKCHHQWISQGNRPVQQPRDGLHPKKIMLSLWWNIQRIVHYELWDNKQSITTNLYCNQLHHLKKNNFRQRPFLLSQQKRSYPLSL